MTEEQKWNKINEKKRDEIAYAQSYNLAVALVVGVMTASPGSRTSEEMQRGIEFWQEYFYNKLSNGKKEKLESKKELKEKKINEFNQELE